MKNKNFITYFFIIVIFGFFLMYPVMFFMIQKGIIKPVYNNIYTVLKPEGNLIERINVKFTNLKNNINTKLSNYLFLYSEVNSYYPMLKNKINFSNNEFSSLGTNSDGEFIFLNKDNFYILQTNQNDEYINRKMDEAISFYNDLSKVTQLYIYLPSRYEFQEFNNAYNIRNMNEIKNNFLHQLDNVTIRELFVKDKEAYQHMFYRTDHHWNSYGAYQGYLDICEMLNLNCPSYDIVLTDMAYHGSIGKMVADKKISDKFMYIDEDTKITALVEGKQADANFKPRKIKEDKGIFYDQYVGYYNGLYSEVIYNGSGDENLLILGDSYAWQIDYLIANEYNKTYVLNPKYVEKLDIYKYIKDNNITKVLVLMESQTTIFDNYDYGYIAKLGGK